MHCHSGSRKAEKGCWISCLRSFVWRLSKQPKIADPGNVTPGIQTEGSGWLRSLRCQHWASHCRRSLQTAGLSTLHGCFAFCTAFSLSSPLGVWFTAHAKPRPRQFHSSAFASSGPITQCAKHRWQQKVGKGEFAEGIDSGIIGAYFVNLGNRADVKSAKITAEPMRHKC